MSKTSYTGALVNCVNMAFEMQDLMLRKSKYSNLSTSEVHVLEAVSLQDKPTMTNVANHLLITIGSLTTAVNKLVQKKMLIKQQDSKDRRVYYLVLTDEAKKVLEFHKKIHDRFDIICDTYIPEEMQEWVLDVLLKIEEDFFDLLDDIEDGTLDVNEFIKDDSDK